MATPLRREIRRLAQLAAPVVLTQVATMMLGVVDTLMVGHVGVEALGAVALGHLWTFGTLVFAMGLLFGIDPIVSQAHGARQRARMGHALQRGIVLALLISVPCGVLWLYSGPALRLLGQDPALADGAAAYTRVQVWSVPFFLVYTVLRQYLQGRGIMRPALLTAVAANLFNVGANWVLIFGELGVPAMGSTGAGVATALTRLFLLVSLLAVVWRAQLLRGGWVPWDRSALRPSGLAELAHFGLPVGVQMGLEVWAFQLCTLLAGLLGATALAAHTIVLNLASLSFMVPLGISFASVTRVGNRLGAGDPEGAQRAAWVAFGMGAAAMGSSALLFVLLRHQLPLLYTSEREVVALAATILPIAACFQLVDGVQAVGAGILRGMGNTRPAAAINVVGFYLLALPLAWWLAFRRGHGLSGIWWGIALGLAVVAVLLLLWVWRRGPATTTAVALARRPR